jgi:cytochrome c-type biogenesis protein CcmH
MTASIEQIKNQLQQLAELSRTGALSVENYQSSKDDLERQLVDAVMAGASAVPASASVPGRLVAGMVAFVGVVGVVGYLWLGNPDGWNVEPGVPATAENGGAATEADGGAHQTDADQIRAMTDGLAAKLKTDPNNAEGWAMLARSYAVQGRFDEALPAYKRSISLRPGHAQTYADFADALAVKGHSLAGEPAEMVAKALALDPNNFKALSLSGTIAFDKQDFKAAADFWERALQHGPVGNPELAKQIKEALDEARQRAGLPVLAALVPEVVASIPAEVAPAAATGAEISGEVVLSATVKGKVSPDDTVFIFAKAAQGPKMPLAILRKQVKDLPLTFSLNDAMAMSPQMKLSSFPEVLVSARVSKGGQAMAQPGDWQGQSVPVKLGAKGVRVEISELVP